MRSSKAAALRPVIIECIGPLTRAFADAVGGMLPRVELARPILVEFKRATVDDMSGFTAIADLLDQRQLSGGTAAFITSSTRWRTILRQAGISSALIRDDAGASAGRRIIVASGPHAQGTAS